MQFNFVHYTHNKRDRGNEDFLARVHAPLNPPPPCSFSRTRIRAQTSVGDKRGRKVRRIAIHHSPFLETRDSKFLHREITVSGAETSGTSAVRVHDEIKYIVRERFIQRRHALRNIVLVLIASQNIDCFY